MSQVGFISKYCVFVPVLYRLQYWGTLHQPPLVKHQGIKLNHNSDKAGTQQHRDFEQDLLRQWKQAFRFASVTKHLIFHIFQLPFSRYLVIYKFHRFSHLFSRLYLKFVSWAQDRSHSLETFRLTTGRCKHSCSVCSVETAWNCAFCPHFLLFQLCLRNAWKCVWMESLSNKYII